MATTSGKNADNGVVEFQFYKPDNRTKWEAFQKAIYDKSTNQYLGRTPKSWGQLLIFYSIFYIVLAAFFAICMQALFATLEERQPKWKMGDGMIGDNPGLGFRPISDKSEDASLVSYDLAVKNSSEKWVKLVDEFLIPYRQNQTIKNFVPCDFFNHSSPGEGEVCQATTDQFGPCGPERQYGYNSLSPCIFLKLNRIIDWTPQYFTSSQPDMPSELREYIDDLEIKNSTERRVWVTCNGVGDIDKENIDGFEYHPKGFSSFYYPYKNVENYLSPIVAVKIDVKPNVVIQVECRAWAHNIHYDGRMSKRTGSVAFELLVDTKPKADSKLEATSVSKSDNLTVEQIDSDVPTTLLPVIASKNPAPTTTAIVNATVATGTTS